MYNRVDRGGSPDRWLVWRPTHQQPVLRLEGVKEAVDWIVKVTLGYEDDERTVNWVMRGQLRG